MRPQVQILLAPPATRPPADHGWGPLTLICDIKRVCDIKGRQFRDSDPQPDWLGVLFIGARGLVELWVRGLCRLLREGVAPGQRCGQGFAGTAGQPALRPEKRRVGKEGRYPR